MDIPGLSWLTGAIFDKELRVSSRRRRNYVLRFVYLSLMTIFLALVWVEEVRSGSSLYIASRMGRAGQNIVVFIVWFQFCAVQLVALVALSTAISDEIHNRTLPALMTTPISSFQIVTGKLMSKLLQIILLMGISLPLLATVRVFGGVPWRFVVLSLCVTLLCVLFIGLFSLFLSIFCKRSYVVMLINLLGLGVMFGLLPLIIGYVVMEGFDVSENVFFKWLSVFNPYILLALETDRMMSSYGSGIPPSFLPGCLVTMLTGCGVLFLLSVVMVRKVALLQATGQLGKRFVKFESKGKPGAKVMQTTATTPIKRVVGPPVLWREMVRPVFGRHRKWFIIVMVLAVLLLFITYAIAAAENALDDNETHMVYAGIMLGLGMLFAIILPATCITSEKESRAWPLLMLTTLSENEVLLGKFVGALRRIVPAYFLLMGHVVLFCMFGIIHPIAIPQIGMIVMWVTVFLCGTGLYFSTLFKHTTTAVIVNFALALTLWLLLPLFLAMLGEVTRSGDNLVETYMNGNPVFQAAVVMDATAHGGWSLHPYHWCEFRMGFLESTFFMFSVMVFHVFIGLLFTWRAKCRLRKNIL